MYVCTVPSHCRSRFYNLEVLVSALFFLHAIYRRMLSMSVCRLSLLISIMLPKEQAGLIIAVFVHFLGALLSVQGKFSAVIYRAATAVTINLGLPRSRIAIPYTVWVPERCPANRTVFTVCRVVQYSTIFTRSSPYRLSYLSPAQLKQLKATVLDIRIFFWQQRNASIVLPYDFFRSFCTTKTEDIHARQERGKPFWLVALGFVCGLFCAHSAQQHERGCTL